VHTQVVLPQSGAQQVPAVAQEPGPVEEEAVVAVAEAEAGEVLALAEALTSFLHTAFAKPLNPPGPSGTHQD